MGLIDSEHFKW